MQSPGEYLKRERELRGITLEKVHEVTRIQTKYLDALEADDYARLPAPAFVKGFIRAYCKHLGVDEDDAVLRYEIFLREQGGGEEEESRVSAPTPEEVSTGPQKANTRNIILLVAAGVVIIIIIYIFSSMDGEDVTERVPEGEAVEAPAEAPEGAEEGSAPELSPAPAPEAETPAKAEVEPKPAPAPEPKPAPAAAPVPKPAAPAAPAKPAPAPAPAPVVEKKAEGRYALTLEATETSWVEITIDNGEPFDVMLRPGEGITWRAENEFALVVGNAGGVAMTFDGKDYGPLGDSGEVIRLELPWKGEP